MTEDNKKENIHEELQRGQRAFDASALLASNGFLSDAVSRLYYYLLHAVRALLLSKGLEPKSHEGALRLLGLHFIKEGIFEPKDAHVFSKLMKFREEADYNPSYVFTADDVAELRKEAEHLAEKILRYLRGEGYL